VSKEAAAAAFKEMLLERGVASTTKWSDAVKACEGDKRWRALGTLGERRQALAEYQTKRLREEKEEKRLRARRARDGFLKMLAENTRIDSTTRWREAEDILGKDARFGAVEDTADREDLFKDFVTELGKKEKEEKKAARKEAKKALEEYLAADGTGLTHKSRFKDLYDDLKDKARSRGWDALDKDDMRDLFEDRIKELKKIEEKRAEQERKQRKKREKEAEKQLEKLLEELSGEGKITHESKFADHEEALAENEGYIALKEDKTLKLKAKDVFAEFVDELKDQFKKDRRVVEDAVRDSGLKVQHFSELAAWVRDLEKWEEDHEKKEDKRPLTRLQAKRPWHVREVFEHMLKRAKEEREEEEKRRQRQEQAFRELLEDFYYRSDHVGLKWSSASRDLDRERAYRDLEEDRRKALFEEHMAGLEEKMPKKKKKKDKDGKKKKKKKGKKKKKKKAAASSSASRSPSRSPSGSRSPSSGGEEAAAAANGEAGEGKKRRAADDDAASPAGKKPKLDEEEKEAPSPSKKRKSSSSA